MSCSLYRQVTMPGVGLAGRFRRTRQIPSNPSEQRRAPFAPACLTPISSSAPRQTSQFVRPAPHQAPAESGAGF